MNTDWQYNNEHVDAIIETHGLTVKQIEARTKKYAVQASKGDCFAKFALGFASHLGIGISQDQNKSRELLKEASSTSDLELLNRIGEMRYYFEFYGDAVESLGRSYEQGFTRSASTLGVLRLRGLGCEQDTETAIALFEEAYAHGDREAALELGMLTFEGRYCEQDTKKAISLCKEAASNGVAEAAYELGRIYDYLEDKKTAVVWMAKAAEMGNVEAQAIAGEYYAMKGETDEVIEQGIQWIENSAKQGHVRSVYMLAVLIAFKKIEGTMQQAFEYCQDAATQGYGRAQYMLSGLYENGDGVEQDDELAQHWLKEAIKNGNESAIALEKRNAERRGRNADSR